MPHMSQDDLSPAMRRGAVCGASHVTSLSRMLVRVHSHLSPAPVYFCVIVCIYVCLCNIVGACRTPCTGERLYAVDFCTCKIMNLCSHSLLAYRHCPEAETR